MKERLEALQAEALQELQGVAGPQELGELRIKYLGKKARSPKFCAAWAR